MQDQMTHAEAMSKLAEIAEENESLREDAERYRWLCRMMFRNDSGHLDLGGEIACNWHDPNKSEIDYAIDSAMPAPNA